MLAEWCCYALFWLNTVTVRLALRFVYESELLQCKGVLVPLHLLNLNSQCISSGSFEQILEIVFGVNLLFTFYTVIDHWLQ